MIHSLMLVLCKDFILMGYASIDQTIVAIEQNKKKMCSKYLGNL